MKSLCLRLCRTAIGSCSFGSKRVFQTSCRTASTACFFQFDTNAFRRRPLIARNYSCLFIWPSNLPPTSEWGYSPKKGPDTWALKYPAAGGKNQSPVDIASTIAQSQHFEPPLSWSYGQGVTSSLINTGCGWRVDVAGAETELSGGPLEHKYELVQFHCHWGDSNCCGSEHTVDGNSYAGELHFVHWNKELFASCPEAIPSAKGLCVIGVLLEVGEANPEIEKLCQNMNSVPLKDDRVQLPSDIVPEGMFPSDHSYWTYDGSLTTPPCYESVTWIVLKNPITISEAQLDCFRQMKKHCTPENMGTPSYVEKNYRPPQSLNDRQISECIA